MEEIRWVLIISGIVLVVGIIIYENHLKSILNKTSNDSEKIEPTFQGKSNPSNPKINEGQLGSYSVTTKITAHSSFKLAFLSTSC